MDAHGWVEETESRIGRGNRILFSRGSVCLKELANLVRKENHRTIVLWKLDLAEESVGCMKRRYPSETWPDDAVSAAREWVAGDTTMRIARRAILTAMPSPGVLETERVSSCVTR